MLVLTDNMLSCQDSIYDYVLSNKIAAYTYLGTDTVVRITYEQPSIRLDLWGGTSGTFIGLDRFNRIIDQLWQNNITTPAAIDEYQYGYDQNSNRTYKANVVGTAAVGYLDEGYSYDNLNRLTTMQRGNLSSGVITGTPAREMDYTLDPTGNWSAYLTKTNGTTDLSQTRTANKVNEITAIGGTPGWATPPAYDPAGNMTSFPQSATPASAFTATYDAWNRMTSISSSGSTVATYQYDGRGRRIVKYTASTSETRHFYYTNNWQNVEERVGSASTMDKQYVWGVRYIDELVCRDYATPQRLYAMQDANFNLTSIANASGDVVERYRFDPYGTRTIMNSSWGTIAASTCNWNIGHQGLIQDVESSLVYVRNRYLHPDCGTWVQREPYGASYIDSNNLYEYTDSDPINLDDPFGLDSGGHWVEVPGTKGHQQRWVPNPPKPPAPPPTPPTTSPTSCPTTCPAPNPAANIANGIGNLIGGLWDLPNNIVGGVLAGLGQASGGKSAPHNGIIETTGVPWMQGGLTVGNYTIYGPPSGPNDQGFGPTTPLDNGPARDHEHQHSCQSQMLGPFYLPANVLGGLLGILSNPFGPDPWHGPGNFMENGPESNPPRPF